MSSSRIQWVEEDQDNSFSGELDAKDTLEEEPSTSSQIIYLDTAEEKESEINHEQHSTFSYMKFLNKVDKIVGFTPDMTYITGMSINLFSQPIFSEKEQILHLSTTQSRLSIVFWNEIDSFCAIYYGLRLLADKNNYKRKTKIIQGVLNIITGLTMGYFTDNQQICSGLLAHAASTILASPFFALATACDLLNASIELYHISQELHFKDWLTQRLQELDFIEGRINEETIAKNNSELSILNNKKAQLYFQITNRCLAHSEDPYSRKYLEAILKDDYPDLWDKCTHYSPEMIIQAKIVDQSIQQQINERFAAQEKIIFTKTLSFIGMTLLAVATFVSCPPLLIVASAICAVVALYYFKKNALNLFSFFKDCRKNPESKEISQQYPSSSFCPS